MNESAGQTGNTARARESKGYFRWVICGLLFFATTINYIDRQVIGILKPTLVQEFGWADERIYAAIVFTFQLAYAIGLLLAVRIIDKLGTRLGFTLAVVLWSIAAIAHAVADKLPWLKLPTINLDASDSECDLDYVANEARETSFENALCNCIGFGSKNSALVISQSNT